MNGMQKSTPLHSVGYGRCKNSMLAATVCWMACATPKQRADELSPIIIIDGGGNDIQIESPMLR